MFEYILNAIGRYVPGDWLPFHLTKDGRHLDKNGLMILPFDEVKPMDSYELTEWLHERAEATVSFGALK